jgi:beta-phosphoglucomutase-like phosphatase (HAD superfamily)
MTENTLLRSSKPPSTLIFDMGWPGKPGFAIFLEADRAVSTRAKASIVFEYAPLGIEAARCAGMRALAV